MPEAVESKLKARAKIFNRNKKMQLGLLGGPEKL